MDEEDLVLLPSRRFKFQSHLMVAGPIGKVAHNYHNNNSNYSNFNDTATITRRTRLGLVESLLSSEGSKKKQEVLIELFHISI
jgi:hypothetical protein